MLTRGRRPLPRADAIGPYKGEGAGIDFFNGPARGFFTSPTDAFSIDPFCPIAIL